MRIKIGSDPEAIRKHASVAKSYIRRARLTLKSFSMIWFGISEFHKWTDSFSTKLK